MKNYNKIEPKYAFIICVTFCLFGLLFFILPKGNKNDTRDELLSDLIKVQQIQLESEAKYKQDFINKCFLARQVYQFQWYRKTETKVGKINLEKIYAMSLKEYNDLMELSWELNSQLDIPWDSWENYIMLAKWILESAICNDIEHNTGEIIKMTGYTEDGFRDAWYHYKHDLNITTSSHPFYIKELFQKYLTTDQVKEIMKDPLKVARFDYAYYSYIHKYYNYQWDWSLTSFHFGDGKTLYWRGAGLKMIPNYRLDGRWKGYYIREYYQTVIEIAQGIAMGKMSRPSRYTKAVRVFKGVNSTRSKYIQTLRIKLKSEEKTLKLNYDFTNLQRDFNDYKIQQQDLMISLARLSDLTLEYKQDKNLSLKDIIVKIKGKIKRGFAKLTQKDKKSKSEDK